MSAQYDLNLVQSQRFRRRFQHATGDQPTSLAGYAWRAQVRSKEDPTSTLLLDLTPHLALDPDDDTWLELDVPGTATAGMGKVRDGAAWDLFVWPVGRPEDAVVLIAGAATLDRAATNMRGAS